MPKVFIVLFLYKAAKWSHGDGHICHHSLHATSRCLLIAKRLWRCCPFFPWFFPGTPISQAKTVTLCASNSQRLTVLVHIHDKYTYFHRSTKQNFRKSSLKKKTVLSFLWRGYSRQIEIHWDKYLSVVFLQCSLHSLQHKEHKGGHYLIQIENRRSAFVVEAIRKASRCRIHWR